MSVHSKLTAIADKIRGLRGLTGTMGLDAMATNLQAEQTSITNALAALADKGATVPDGSTSDALAGLIEALEVGGGGITFTPASAGVVTLTLDNYENLQSVLWVRIDKQNPADGSVQSYAGATIFDSGIKNGSSQICTTIYDTGQYSAVLYCALSYYRSTLSYASQSKTDAYGGAIIRVSNDNHLSFYAVDGGGKGIRVGATYVVFPIYLQEVTL